MLVEPDPTKLPALPKPHGDGLVSDLTAAGLDEHTDVVLTDHHRPEIGAILKAALAAETRWIGIMGNPNHEGPHIAALKELGRPGRPDRPGAPPDRPEHRQPDPTGDRRGHPGRPDRRSQRPAGRLRLLTRSHIGGNSMSASVRRPRSTLTVCGCSGPSRNCMDDSVAVRNCMAFSCSPTAERSSAWFAAQNRVYG